MNEANENTASRMAALIREPIAIVPYDPEWPALYAAEEMLLERSLPPDLMTRIAHIGSTAVPGLSAKPIIDVQVEVSSLEQVRREVVQVMSELTYEFIWRPTMGERAPFYAWFIKRNGKGQRTFHVHMVEPDEASEARLLFRDRLRTHPDEAEQYENVKRELAAHYGNDRSAYTRGKADFIAEIVRRARVSGA